MCGSSFTRKVFTLSLAATNKIQSCITTESKTNQFRVNVATIGNHMLNLTTLRAYLVNARQFLSVDKYTYETARYENARPAKLNQNIGKL